jgi:hypothetical protein
VQAEGGRIVCLPEMAAEYIPRDDLKKLWRQYWRFGFYRAKTNSRHPTSLRTTHLLPPAVVLAAVTAVLAPRPLRRLARLGVCLYAGAVGLTSAQTARHASGRVAAGLPAVFVVMHASWGIGFMTGLVRFGGLSGLARTLLTRRSR